MKLTSLITAALAAASSAYTLCAGAPTIGRVAPRALTTKYVTKYWNTTIINGAGGFGTENTGATGTGDVGVVIPSGTGNIGPTGTSMVLMVNGTGRYKYAGTDGDAPGLDVTTVLSFVTVVPTPATNVTIKNGTAGVAAAGYVHAYYGDPLRQQHLVGIIPGKTIVDNTPTAILASEVIRTPGTVNKRNKRESVEEALNASLSAKNNFFSTYRAGFIAHTQVFARLAQSTDQKKLELQRHDAEDAILTEDDLGYIAAFNLRRGHMKNAGLTSEDTTMEELAALFGDNDDLEKLQCTACELGSPVRPSSPDDLSKTEIEIGSGAHDAYEGHFDRLDEKFPKQGTHGAIVHIGNDTVINLDENDIPTGTQSGIDAKLPPPTLDDAQFRNFWSSKNIREWSEKHFAQRLGPRDQVEDVEIAESTGQPIEIAKREAFFRVTEADILKGFPEVKLVGEDMPLTPMVMNDGDSSDKFIASPATYVTVTVWDCGTQTAGNAKRQAATVGTEYGNQNPDMVSFEEPTTFRTVKISLAGGIPGPNVVLSSTFPTPTATADSEYGNQNPDMVNLPELDIQRTFSRITDTPVATAYAKRQTELENLNMVDLEEVTTVRSVEVVLSSNGPAPTVDLSAVFSTPTATADNPYGYQNPNMADLTELGIQRTFSRITDAAEATKAYQASQVRSVGPQEW